MTWVNHDFNNEGGGGEEDESEEESLKLNGGKRPLFTPHSVKYFLSYADLYVGGGGVNGLSAGGKCFISLPRFTRCYLSYADYLLNWKEEEEDEDKPG